MSGFLKWVCVCLATVAGGLAIYLVGIQMAGNFAIVVPGEVYRSNVSAIFGSPMNRGSV